MTFGTKVISLVIGVASGVIVARILGPTGKGTYALIAIFPGLILSFIHLGVAQSVIYHIKKEKATLAKQRINALLVACFVSSLSIVALIFLKDQLFSSFLKDVPSKYFPILLFLVPVAVIEAYSAAFLRAEEKFKLYNGILFLVNVLTFFGVVIVLLVYDLGLSGMVALLCARSILGAVLNLRFTYWRTSISFRPDFALLKKNIAFGFKSYMQTLTGFLHYKIDVFMLAALLSASDVGYYSIAVGLASLIFFIPESIGLVLLPKLAGLGEREANAFTTQVCRNTLFVTAIPALGILIFGRLGIRLLYGTEYLPACKALYLLLPGVMAMSLYKIIGRNFTSRNKQEVTIFAGLVGLVINIGLNIYLIPRSGIAGAALATTVSYSITSIILLAAFVRDTRCKVRDALMVNHSDIAAWFNLLWNRSTPIQKET